MCLVGVLGNVLLLGLFAAGYLVVRVGAARLRAWRLRNSAAVCCGVCFYDTRGLAGGVCPECGAVLTKAADQK